MNHGGLRRDGRNQFMFEVVVLMATMFLRGGAWVMFLDLSDVSSLTGVPSRFSQSARL